jgi:hypothetical protein
MRKDRAAQLTTKIVQRNNLRGLTQPLNAYEVLESVSFCLRPLLMASGIEMTILHPPLPSLPPTICNF